MNTSLLVAQVMFCVTQHQLKVSHSLRTQKKMMLFILNMTVSPKMEFRCKRDGPMSPVH